jgi:transcriptional regulator with XRE-family HTH domain
LTLAICRRTSVASTSVHRSDDRSASYPALLLGVVLRYQREAHHLSLADVAKRIAASSRNAYARYEHGTSMPKLDTVQEILKAVAPELALTLGPRKGPTAAPRAAKAKRRSGRAA